MNKGAKVSMESRHQRLMLDYLDLQKETEVKRKKLLIAKKEKRKLLGVVKFLQRKVESFSKKPSHRIQGRLKKQHGRLSPPSNLLHTKFPVKDGREIKEASVPSSTTLLDLNQILPPNGEEKDEFQTELRSSTADLPKWKISWQDQIVGC